MSYNSRIPARFILLRAPNKKTFSFLSYSHADGRKTTNHQGAFPPKEAIEYSGMTLILNCFPSTEDTCLPCLPLQITKLIKSVVALIPA